MHRDGASPAGALDLLAAIVEDRTWERMADPKGVSFTGRFRAFVEARKPYGLGYDPDQLPKLLGLRHPHEGVPRVAARMSAMREAVRTLLLEEVSQAALPGRPGNERGTFVSVGQSDTVTKVVARLKRDAPQVAQQVVSGELSPNAAAKQMGWRRPRIVVSTPERVAEALRRTMEPADLSRLVSILGEGQ